MSLQVITNILNDYLSLEQEDKETVVRLLLEVEDEDIECPCCAAEAAADVDISNLRVSVLGSTDSYKDSEPTLDLQKLWKEYVQSKGVEGTRL